ncbi:hypothetical protein [Paenibacillus oleatilyticus]|nr:hypothetical protein [Paenibacillus oleatilyticus]MBU7316079.1 hypothetical protein [Paenibacillus oleatilyticus]
MSISNQELEALKKEYARNHLVQRLIRAVERLTENMNPKSKIYFSLWINL